MYSLLLVDDERLELETLRDYVAWNSMGIDTVYTAKNGKEAFEKIQRYSPEIVVTDIHMPVMSGIELAKLLHEEANPVKVIFLTGYDDFSYIKEAFELEAVDFVLKPFTMDSIKKAIDKVKQRLEKEKILEQSLSVLEQNLIESLVFDREEIAIQSLTQFEKIMVDQNKEVYFGMIQAVGNMIGIDEQRIKNSLSEIQYVLREEGRITFFVLYFVDYADSAKRIYEQFEKIDSDVFMLYAGEKVFAKDLRKTYMEMKTCRQQIFYQEEGKILCLENLRNTRERKENSMLQSHENSIMEMKKILRMSPTQGKEQLEVWFQSVAVSRPDHAQVRETVSYLLTELLAKNIDRTYSILTPEKVRQQIDIASTLTTIEAICMEVWSRIFAEQDLMTGKSDSKKREYVVISVKEYVKVHYKEVISIEEMAESIGLSPNYVRNLFKEQEGITINDWMIAFRMDRACELLENRKLQIKQIGQMVGYENNSYFCAVFSKKMHMTPNEFRNQIG